MTVKKRIAITMGDAAGIGPEVLVKSAKIISKFCEPVMICDGAFLKSQAKKFRADISGAALVDLNNITKPVRSGKVSAAAGRAAYEYIVEAVSQALVEDVSAVVTAPINKESFSKAGVKFPGHTELLAKLTGTREFAMMLCGGGLRVVLVTAHAALKDVPKLINEEDVVAKIGLAAEYLGGGLKINRPRIGVAGLNPHAGDGGIFGTEERKVIIPAIKSARRKFRNAIITGPVAPDALFFKAKRGEYDAVVCMYHDQGLVALKMEAFEEGVNVTLGLPIIRTSPDHGTAFDIAGKGKANPRSFIEAVKLAVRLAR